MSVVVVEVLAVVVIALKNVVFEEVVLYVRHSSDVRRSKAKCETVDTVKQQVKRADPPGTCSPSRVAVSKESDAAETQLSAA